jgi:hypothetical protein
MPSSRPKRNEPQRPPMDEWGVYDPTQAGLAAVLQRIKTRRPVAGEGEALAAAKRNLVEIIGERNRK